MRASLQLRVNLAVAGALAAGVLTAGYGLVKFHSYESQVSRLLSGEHKSVLQARLLEARIKAAEGWVDSPGFPEGVRAILDEYKVAAGREVRTKSMEAALVPTEDPFVLYRNVKTTAFHLYRTAWSNRWMNLAQTMGLIVGDLDNVSHLEGDKAIAGVNAKIAQITNVVTTAGISRQAKLAIFGHLAELRTQVTKYAEAREKATAARQARLELLRDLSTQVKALNDAQEKAVSRFAGGSGTGVFGAAAAVLFLVFFSVAWFLTIARALARHLSRSFGDLARQVSSWISHSGTPVLAAIERPRNADAELHELYDALDAGVKRVNQLRKEDVAVKRLLSTPFALVSHSQKRAVYWNSALCILGKVRAVDESGPVPYPNVLRFADVHGKVVDPVERCFAENREVVQLALLKSSQESVACQVSCTPFAGPDRETEYVLVQIRDLREENKRLESELDRQLEGVRNAAEELSGGVVPKPVPSWCRRPVAEAVEVLQYYAVGRGEEARVHEGRLRTACERYRREGELKGAVHRRTEQVGEEIRAVRERVGAIEASAGALSEAAARIGRVGQGIGAGCADLRHRADSLGGDLKRARALLSWCLRELKAAEELARRVRTHEKEVSALVRKASLLNVNNNILESKSGAGGGLSPQQLMLLTENFNEIVIQFQRAYGLIEASVRELETGFAGLGSRIRDQIREAESLYASDKGIVETAAGTQGLAEGGAAEITAFTRVAGIVREETASLAASAKEVELKAGRLTEIGGSSLALHAQLLKGLEAALDEAGSKLQRQAEHVAPVLKGTGVP